MNPRKTSKTKGSRAQGERAQSGRAQDERAQGSPSIADALAGKHIAITGATGFLGTALIERLLRCVPGCELSLLIRPGRFGAQRRAEREIFRNNCFDRLKEELGAQGFAECVAERVKVVACDISKPGLGAGDDGAAGADGSAGADQSPVHQTLADCDILIHSAATVAFDNPLDQAFETNLAGPIRLMQALHAAGSAPHFIAISTAYVSGSRKGEASEQLLAGTPYAVEVDWQAEMESARRLRARVEDDSREPGRLAEFSSEAAKRLGAAGTTALATRREQLRQRWVEKTLIEAGRSRAAALGFADAYTFTKALAEQALSELRGGGGGDGSQRIPLSIVRPSIIESALAEPYPGWIRGFRMAEPIIINYAQGLLQDFPAIPESIIDVIPVDLVVAAVCARAGLGPASADGGADEVDVIHVSSGALNPLYFEDLHDWSYDWFVQHPVYDDHDQPIVPPKWSFPSRTRVADKLKRAQLTLHLAEHVLRLLPVRGRAAEVYAEIEERGEKLDRVAEYVDLYGMYVECYATFGTDRLMELWEKLGEADRDLFCFDPRVVDWGRYLNEIHLPSVVSMARIKTEPSRRAGGAVLSIMERRRQEILSPDRHLAAFDLENTLLASNVVASWGWLATNRQSLSDQARIVGRTLLETPKLLRLDRADRSDFLRYFYKRFSEAPTEQLAHDSWEMFSDLLLAQAFPEAIRRVRQHRALGHQTVLITGALDFVIEPFRPLFDEIICPSLTSSGAGAGAGARYTGRMSAIPPIGENRAQALRDYAHEQGLDLSQCVAYADSTSDLPMLEVVGFAVAVNPEPKLASLARRRGWLVEHFSKSAGGPRKLLPIAPARAGSARP